MKQTVLLLLLSLVIVSCGGSKVKYESVEGDSMKTRIYTLDNGLKVYMSVNPESPRIQTYIAVKVGGKNDPAETTGLAHYFEHLMFKGTQQFGTQNYEQEKPLLDEIEKQFEEYRKLTDPAERKAKYRVIDSLSYEASKLAIPNEYDKLMAAIGASGTNAWTSYDETVYTEDIPSNEIENWAKIQADRFANNVIRGFHTELETVYEEKNMSLTRDSRKAYEAMNAALFPNHPYGTQTVLGTQEQLKSPSITNIKKYYSEWYVPNNMAICVAGDFNPDSMITIIDRHFGSLKPNPNLPKLNFKPEKPIEEPIVKEVYGLEAENLTIGYRFAGAKSDDYVMLTLIDGIMNNGMSGLIDLNIKQKQRLLSANSGVSASSDYTVFALVATPKQGQALQEAQAILLEQVELLKKGEFEESLLKAIVNNRKLYEMQGVEYNQRRAYEFVRSFIDENPWENRVNELDKMGRITKEQVVDFANANFKNNYAVILKRQGKDLNEKKMEKPEITPIFTNRDTASSFLREIQASYVKPIEPVFVDFTKDMQILNAKQNIPILYKKNIANELFSLNYVVDMGMNENRLLGLAAKYLDFLGTSKYTPEQIKQEFYELACNYYVSVADDKIFFGLNGLSENQAAALELFENLLSDAQPNEEALTNLKSDELKKRGNFKTNQGNCFYALQNYAIWGAKSPMLNGTLSDQELEAATSVQLIDTLRSVLDYQCKVLYYGPQDAQTIISDFNTLHQMPAMLLTVDKNVTCVRELTTENKVLVAPYDAAQIYYMQYSNRGDQFDATRTPVNTLYNEYFGGGMNGIVFQEMREARGLAYSASATMSSPYKREDPYTMVAFIATQNDKMSQAITAFEDIINNMPVSEGAFKIAKEGLLTRLRTERVTKDGVLRSYLAANELGLDLDPRKALFEAIQNMTLDDVLKYQQQYVKDNKWTYAILGRENELDMATLSKYGKVQRLTLTDIFGY